MTRATQTADAVKGHTSRIARLAWLLGIGWILTLMLAATATLLAGSVVGIPAAFRCLNGIPEAAWGAPITGESQELVWRSYC